MLGGLVRTDRDEPLRRVGGGRSGPRGTLGDRLDPRTADRRCRVGRTRVEGDRVVGIARPPGDPASRSHAPRRTGLGEQRLAEVRALRVAERSGKRRSPAKDAHGDEPETGCGGIVDAYKTAATASRSTLSEPVAFCRATALTSRLRAKRRPSSRRHMGHRLPRVGWRLRGSYSKSRQDHQAARPTRRRPRPFRVAEESRAVDETRPLPEAHSSPGLEWTHGLARSAPSNKNAETDTG